MRIGVIGGGTVGRATARAYLEFADEVRVYDLDPGRTTHGSGARGLAKVLECDLLFVCLPTPQHAMGGGLDVSAVEDFCRSLKGPDHDYTAKNIVIKSTVPVGTTRRLAEAYGLPNLVHSPEFLTARCSEADARVPAVNVIGLPGQARNFRNQQTGKVKRFFPGNGCGELLEDLYRRRFPGTPVEFMTSDESEAAKLCLNAWFAVKVSMFNELAAFCEALGCDWEEVRRVILADGRTTAHHTRVPGPDGRRGFGGACLPKDLAEFAASYSALVGSPVMSAAALRRNQFDRGEVV